MNGRPLNPKNECEIKCSKVSENTYGELIDNVEAVVSKKTITKLEDARSTSEYNLILKGARLGLTAYQLPKDGIPLGHLSEELLKLILQIGVSTSGSMTPVDKLFGLALYDPITHRINFYSLIDKEHKTVLGYIDTSLFESNSLIDLVLNKNSQNAVANSAVTEAILALNDKIPTKVGQLENDLNFTSNEGTVTGVKYEGGKVLTPVDGVITLPQLQNDSYYTKNAIDNLLLNKADLVDGKLPPNEAPVVVLNGILTNDSYLVITSSLAGNLYYNSYTRKIYQVVYNNFKYELKEIGSPNPGLVYYIKSTNKFYIDTKGSGLTPISLSGEVPNLATVATTGSYNDLTDKPNIPVLSNLATVATTGSYNDLLDKPNILEGHILSDWDQTDELSPDFIRNKPDIPTVLDVLTSTNTTSALSAYLGKVLNETKAPKPENVIYVTREYWSSHLSSGTCFSQPDTCYILIEDLTGLSGVTLLKFGRNCVLKAVPGCKFGDLHNIRFNDTYVDVGQYQIFDLRRLPDLADYSGGAPVTNGTTVSGTFANGRILPEWWGAKSGRGVEAQMLLNGSYPMVTLVRQTVYEEVNGHLVPKVQITSTERYLEYTDLLVPLKTFKNKATKLMADDNARAINKALQCAGNSEVYLGGPCYVIGGSITDTVMGKRLEAYIPSDEDSSVTSYTKLYVEGDLIAFDDFRGIKPPMTNYWSSIPTMIYLSMNNPRVIVRGALIVPFSALDKELIITNTIPSLFEESDLGKLYVVNTSMPNNVSSTDATEREFDVYEIYKEYTSTTTDAYQLNIRLVGHWLNTVQLLNEYKNPSKMYGGKNGKAPGMFGINFSSFGGYIDIRKILKGDHRTGYWSIASVPHKINITNLDNNTVIDKWEMSTRLASYRYKTEVMHLGECTAVCMRCVNASYVKIGNIEGFNDGISDDFTYTPETNYTLFNRFDIENIGANFGIHILTGKAQACLAKYNWCKTDTYRYFDGTRWQLGGFYPASAGFNGVYSTFSATRSDSTYMLVEGNKGFGNHWFEFDTVPLRDYPILFDLSHCNDNKIIMHGNSSGDTGRIILWSLKAGVDASFTKDGILSYPSIMAGYAVAPGEDIKDAWFLVESSTGYGSLHPNTPYTYSYIAALEKVLYDDTMTAGHFCWNNSAGYPVRGKLSPLINSLVVYSAWEYPYGKNKNYINFRNESCNNLIVGGLKHLLCYESVFNDGTGSANELHYCQSRYAMYEDTAFGLSSGNWTVFNSGHPYYNVVRFDTEATPLNYHPNGIDMGDDNTPEKTRLMMVPDENTRACLKVVSDVSDIDALGYGLYVVTNETELSTSSSPYKLTRYRLYLKYKCSPYKINKASHYSTFSPFRHKEGNLWVDDTSNVDRVDPVGWISIIYIPPTIASS